MRFKNKRYITSGVDSKVNLLLQLFVWSCIDRLNEPTDYLQVFKLTLEDGKQKITHIQEQPEYKREYLIMADTPIFIGTIFVIDNEDDSTMLLAEEY